MGMYILTDKTLNEENRDFLETAKKRLKLFFRFMLNLDGSEVCEFSQGVVKPVFPIDDYDKTHYSDLLLVNIPIDFNQVVEQYPNWTIAGYAHDRDEAEKIRSKSGIENVLVIDRGDEEWDNTLKYGYGHLSGCKSFKGVFTLDNVDAVVAEESRRKLVNQCCGCLGCHEARHYKSVQECFLERRGSRNDNLRDLFDL